MNEPWGGEPVDALTESFAGGERDAFDQLAEDFAARCREGQAPSISAYEALYPEHASLIRKLLPTVAMMEQLKRDRHPDDAEPLRRAAPERFGEFRVVRELGRGGMGVVYEAIQESLGRHVALKVIHEVRLDAKRLQRFEREARAVAHLHHTNIVPIYAVGEHDGLPYYAMQYIQGIGLDVLLGAWRKDGAPQGAERWMLAARVAVQAAEALQYAHEQGVLHRDVKPANLLLDAYRNVWITDFGLAKLAGQDDLTASGDVVGTLRYLAPEALRGESSARSDVYSLGLTLYELLTLSAPFGELSHSELLRRVSEGTPPRPRSLDPRIPRDLETIVLTATAREPAHRYATARALADDLMRYLDDRPIAARRATRAERAWRWSRRNPGTAALAASAAGALVLAAALGWVGYANTAVALENERHATRRAEDNVALSLKVFARLFETLAGREDDVRAPALGPRGPAGRRGPGGPGHGPEMPPAPPRRGPGRRGPDPERDRADSQETVALLQSVLQFYREFARQNAANPRLEGEAAWAYRKVGALYQRLGKDAEAEQAYGQAITMLENLVKRFPADVNYRTKLVETYDMADPRTADPAVLATIEARLARAQDLVDALVAEAPDNPKLSMAQAHVYAKHGVVLQRMGRAHDAEPCYVRAIALNTALVQRAIGADRPALDLATMQEALGVLRLEQGQRGDGLAWLDAAAGVLEALAQREHVPPPVVTRLESLAAACERFGAAGHAAQLRHRAEDVHASIAAFPPPERSGGPTPRP